MGYPRSTSGLSYEWCDGVHFKTRLDKTNTRPVSQAAEAADSPSSPQSTHTCGLLITAQGLGGLLSQLRQKGFLRLGPIAARHVYS